MRLRWLVLAVFYLAMIGPAATALAQEAERIVTPEEVEETTRRSAAYVPLKIITVHRVITGGMEKGLIKVERNHLRERLRLWTDRLRQFGIGTLFGGMGEQTGFGGGGSYTVRPAERQSITFLARGTLARYQEFDIQWTSTAAKSQFLVEGSHQWRPKENFYGLGHRSQTSTHTDFALSQSWIGTRFEATAPEHFRWGVDHKFVAAKAAAGTNSLITSTPDVFPNLPGFGERIRLQSTGEYVEADFSQGEYGWSGKAHVGASYQQGLSPSRLRYFNYDWRAEGRMPVVKGQSGLVGQFDLNLNRPPPFRVIERNDGGYTPKVDIDSAGRYVLKFDPKGARERNAGVERIGTLILYAAGYNVPHNTILYFRPADLLIDKNSKYEDPFGNERPLTREYLDAMLRDIDPMPDGRYRGIASLFLQPPILGPFVFSGRRQMTRTTSSLMNAGANCALCA